MKNKFISNLIFLLGLNIPIKALWILYIDRKVYNHANVGQEIYGEYASILSFTIIFQFLLDLGVSNFNNRSIAQDPKKISLYYPNILLIKLLLTIVYLVTLFIIAYSLDFNEKSIFLLKLIAISQTLNIFIYFNKSNLSGLHLFRVDSIFSVLDRFIASALCVLTFFNILPIEFDIEWYVIFQMIGYFISAIISTSIIFKKIDFSLFKFDIKLTTNIIKEAFPFTILGILMILYSRSDIVMINELLGEEGAVQAGVYAGAYKLLDAGSMVCFLFASLLLPIFSKLIADKESIKPIINFTFKSLIIPVSIFSIVASFSSVFIMNNMYISAESSMYQTFSILIFSFIPLACQYTFGTLLTAGNYIKILNWSAGFGFMLNILLNIYLIPKYGALGAATATIITQSLANGIQLYFAIKLFDLKIKAFEIAKGTVLITLIILISYYQYLIPYNGFIKLGTCLGLGIILAYLLKLFDLHSVLSIIELKKKANN